MTRQSIEAMRAGLGLDRLVAERVLGLHVVPDGLNYRGVSVGPNGGRDLPHYSTDVKAAWTLVERFAERMSSGCWSVFGLDGQPRGYRAGFGNEIFADGETAPVAICRAALIAVLNAEGA